MSNDRRDAFYMGAKSNSPPNAQGAPLAGELLQWATLAALGFAGVALAFAAGYRANDKPPTIETRIKKVWRFVERCQDNPYKPPDPRRFEPQTIPRTNRSALELLHAPDYAGHGRKQYAPKGWSRGRPPSAGK